MYIVPISGHFTSKENHMSVISNMHTAVVYDAKKSKAMEGQRLVVTIAKQQKDGSYLFNLQQTMCTSIPQIDKAFMDAAFSEPKMLTHFGEYLESVQNKLIASRIKAGNKTISTEELSVSGIVLFLSEETQSDKWTSERIATWFADNLVEHIGIALVEKGFDDAKMEKSLSLYEKKFADVFSSRAVIPRKVAIDLEKALKLHPNQKDDVISKFQARINKVLEESSLIESLGL
jgi:aspartate/methionine/tyrosine aminotransferase